MSELMAFDHSGKPIEVPARFNGTYAEFSSLVNDLKPDECSYPDGQRLHKGKPCRRKKSLYDCCEHHAKSVQRKEIPFSKFIPKGILSRVVDHANHEQLLNISHDVAVIMSRFEQLIARTDTGEYSDLWGELKEAWRELADLTKEIAAETDPETLAELKQQYQSALLTIGRIITKGADVEAAWADVIKLENMLVGLKKLEAARRKEMGMTLSVDQAFALAKTLQEIVADEVEDVATKTRISVRLATVLGMQVTSPKTSAVATIEPVAIEAVDVGPPSIDDMLAKFVRKSDEGSK